MSANTYTVWLNRYGRVRSRRFVWRYGCRGVVAGYRILAWAGCGGPAPLGVPRSRIRIRTRPSAVVSEDGQ